MSGGAWRWLVEEWQWPRASLFAAVALLALLPLWAAALGTPLALIYLQLPVYLLHQFEEHEGDRFRGFINDLLAGGRDGLGRTAAFWINALVWVVCLASLYLARFDDLAWGLVAAYLTLVNGVVHAATAARLGRSHPGLWTALLLFLPLGGWAAYRVGAAAGAGWESHLAVAGGVAAGHLGILAHVRLRLARLG